MNLYSIIERSFLNTAFECIHTQEGLIETYSNNLHIKPELLSQFGKYLFRDLSFYFRQSHLELLAKVLENTESSENDRSVIISLLANACISAQGSLALCQDTGTALMMGWKSENIKTGVDDQLYLSQGIAEAYAEYNLRSSQVAPKSFFDEYDTGNNLPAQIHTEAVPDFNNYPVYRFLCIAKGAGSSNKTAFFQMTKALLQEEAFTSFLKEKIVSLGTAACPPYRLALVVGGTSPEENLKILKLASTEILDSAPYFDENVKNDDDCCLYRDAYWEAKVLDIAKESGLGAQFGGTALALDARVIRLSRHAGSCPVSIGVSCSAHRNLLGYIDSKGIHIEKTEKHPLAYLKSREGEIAEAAEEIDLILNSKDSMPAIQPNSIAISLSIPVQNTLNTLKKLDIGSRIVLSGKIIVARDAAHLRWHSLIEQNKELPDYLQHYPIMYAGPSETPQGKVIGSFGPTTAQRMDPYAEELLSRGISLITLAKGNRTPSWAEACKKYGGFYLGIIGGAAALIAEKNICSSEIIDYPELGMEAVRLIEVKGLDAFILINDRGEDYYQELVSRLT